MRQLATYSIETDQTVLLVYTDGRSQRVPVVHLRDYLNPADLSAVRAGLRLRRHFLHHHMPKAALVMAAGGLVALLAVTGQPLATWWAGAGAQSVPEPTVTPAEAIVRSIPADQPDGVLITPTPLVSSMPLAPAAAPPPARRKVAKPTRPSVPLTSALPGVLPPQLSPTPLPNSGEVLGEDIGPSDPSPSPTPLPSTTPQPLASPSPLPTPTEADKNGKVL